MRRVINTPDAYRSKSPLVQAIVDRGLVFVSGMPPVDREGQTVGDDITTQTDQVMRNLKTILEAAGVSMGQIVRMTVFYTHREDYAALDAVYRRYFPGGAPSRSALIVAGLVRPEWRIEIDAIATAPAGEAGGRDA
ncbi:MAG TPA: RidA family protein [Candidatus Dormibacteraeota bacterium]|nr:RidA family protein [Candidatus Dormibacteraeota bacterium]